MTNEFKLVLTEEAKSTLREINKKSVFKAVTKSLQMMESNLRHPSLHTHKYDDKEGPNGEEVFESYAQNNTPGAYRIFWYYGPNRKEITIIGIQPHP